MLPNTKFSYHFPKNIVITTIKRLLAHGTSAIVRWIAHYREYRSFEDGNRLTSNHIQSGNDRPQYYTNVHNNTSHQSSSSSLCSIHCWAGRNELSPVTVALVLCLPWCRHLSKSRPLCYVPHPHSSWFAPAAPAFYFSSL